MRVIYDVESRSEVDIKTRGLDVYAHHPSTEMLCATVATDNFIATASFVDSSDGRDVLENEMRALGLVVVSPDVLLSVLRAAKTVVASNVAFDQLVTSTTVNCHIPRERFSCTMARAMRHGLPGSLENGAKVLGLPEGKDKEGNRLSKQCWKPRPTWTKWHNTPPSLRKTAEPGPKWFEDAKRLARNAAYNAADVRVSLLMDKAIPELEPAEWEIWQHVWDMNLRGIPLDPQMIQGAIAISEEAQRDLQDRIRTYTGGMIQSLKAPAQLSAWSRRYGYDMDSWNKEAVVELIADPRCPEPVKVVARARQEAARGSVAKYETAAEMVSPDGRLRHQLLYAGTSTLRLAGRGVQPLNLPRPKIQADKSAALADIKAGREIRVPQWKIDYDPERALDAIRRGDLATLRTIGDPEEILSDNIRGMIAAPTGKIITSPDLSAIEARGVFWLVDCEKALQAYRAGECLYCQLASTMFGFPVKKKENPEERQYGKVGILQCFEADTQVLTRGRGAVSIVDITEEDLLWDGIEWVRHRGVVARGKKHTTNFLGVKVTQDHLILTRQGWRTVSDLQKNPRQSERDLAIWLFAGMKPGDVPIVDFAIPDDLTSGADVSAASIARRLWRTSKKGDPLAAMFARIERLLKRKWCNVGTRKLCQNIGIDCDGSPDIARCWHGRTTARVMQRRTTKIAAFLSRLNGWMRACFSHGYALDPIGTGPNTALIGATLMAPTLRKTADWRRHGINSTTNDDLIGSNTRGGSIPPRVSMNWFVRGWRKLRSLASREQVGQVNNSSSTNPRDVYDIADAGPRHRFTIVTPDGRYLLAHNCGYGSGAAKVAMANKLDEELAQRIVGTYRSDYAEVPAAWRDLERSAINAIHNPGYMTTACNGKVQFVFEGGWLRLRRPSGTWMYLPDAGVDYEGRLYYHSWIKGAWREESIWGGVLINFVVQGMCRELMYRAEMRLAQDPRFELFLQCYDSLSALVDHEHGQELCDVMIREMTTPPAWAPDFPLAAEGKPKLRYS